MPTPTHTKAEGLIIQASAFFNFGLFDIILVSGQALELLMDNGG
jgi:hypothetical protein